MESDNLVRMANQIGDYWSSYPKAEALDAIAKHIHGNWERRMRDALKAHIDKGGKGLSPLVLEALTDYFKGPKKPTSSAAVPGKASNKGARQPSGT